MSELLEKILDKKNMNAAYKKVCANKGAGGVDDVTIEELGDYIKENWDSIREQIRQSTCVKRAISNEVLARAGLISCLAYYDVRHALKLC